MYKTNFDAFPNAGNKYDIKIEDLTFNFAKQVIILHKYLTTSVLDKEFIISKQIVRSGTSIAANVAEAMFPQSDADFLSKMNIALKEANETKLWIRLLKECDYISEEKYQTLLQDLKE